MGRYGPFTLVAATFLGLAAYSSARTSLKELVPWLPTSLCLFVLLTVYFIPTIREALNTEETTQISMEEGRSFIFPATPVEPGSVQSEGETMSRQQSLDMQRWLSYDISFMGRPESLYSGGQSSPESNIDLEEAYRLPRIVAQRMVSRSQPGYTVSSLLRTSSDSNFPLRRFSAAAPRSQRIQPRDCPRSLSPGSLLMKGLPQLLLN